VEVLAHGQVETVDRLPDGSCEVRLEGGTVRADMVGAFFGLVPDVGFLKKSGLRVDRGILVDEHLNTGFPGVYAAGDCAQIYHPEIRDYWVSVGHDNARLLGRIAALNLTSGKAREKAEPESVFEVRGIRVNTSWWMDY
jgi:NADPH-dependent 2,4-dienoyl-CoA reductase/sulfur reductase-like enzyme